MPEPEPELCPLCEKPLDDGRALQMSLEGVEAHSDCVLEKLLEQRAKEKNAAG